MVRTFKNIKSRLSKSHILLSCTLVVFVFAFVRLPFFIWMPMAGIIWDSVSYFEIVEIMKTGHLIDFSWLPPGYVFISYFISLFSSHIITHIIVQSLIFLFACLYLVIITGKYYGKISYLVAIAMCMVIIDDFAMAFDTFILTESFFRSSLIFLSAVFIWALNAMNKRSFIFLGIMIFLPAILRMNGLYIYYFLPVVLLYLILFKGKTKLYVSFLVPFLFLNILWTILNGVYSNNFGPGYPGKGMPSGDAARKGWREGGDERTSRYKTFYYCLYAPIRKKRDFYFENLTLRHFNYYPSLLTDPSSTKLSNSGYFNASQSLRKGVAQELFVDNNPYEKNLTYFSNKNKIHNANKWLAMLYVLYKVKELLLYNFIYIIWFFIVFFAALFWLIKRNFKNKNLFIILGIAGIHLISIVVLTILNIGDTSSSLYRYVHPSEFAIYLVIALSFIVFKYNISFKLPRAKE